MKTLTVNPGVCGLTAKITAEKNDDDEVVLSIETECKAAKKFVESLGAVDPYEACFVKPGMGPVYEAASENLSHGACPMAAAVMKAIEAEAGLALPRDVEIKFE